MPLQLPRIVVTALRGGSGKTTMSLGLIQALKDKGLKVAPFKKGPDYIDPLWHTEAAGQLCRNLDPYIMGKKTTLASFAHFGSGSQAAVVEGNRGLFDGMDVKGSYSTAELAKWLEAPVVLALDCSMTSRTAAALVLGCREFDPELNLAGVILNPVGTRRQERIITKAIEQYTGISVVGAVPRLALNMPQRHMGLVPPQEHSGVAEALTRAGRSVAEHVEVEALWEMMASAPPLADSPPPSGLHPPWEPPAARPRIGVVRDAAFGFYYPENLEALTNFGADLVFCSALSDSELPRVDALYLGGGFPETHAQQLAANQSFRASVRRAAEDGLPIYAECGGMIYLGAHLSVAGRKYPMAGVFAMEFLMCEKPQGHGYTHCQVVSENPFFPLGFEFRAHEFHYSLPRTLNSQGLRFAYQVKRGKGIMGDCGGLLYKNVLATYHHVHCLGHAQWASGIMSAARRRAGKNV